MTDCRATPATILWMSFQSDGFHCQSRFYVCIYVCMCSIWRSCGSPISWPNHTGACKTAQKGKWKQESNHLYSSWIQCQSTAHKTALRMLYGNHQWEATFTIPTVIWLFKNKKAIYWVSIILKQVKRLNIPPISENKAYKRPRAEILSLGRSVQSHHLKNK